MTGNALSEEDFADITSTDLLSKDRLNLRPAASNRVQNVQQPDV